MVAEWFSYFRFESKRQNTKRTHINKHTKQILKWYRENIKLNAFEKPFLFYNLSYGRSLKKMRFFPKRHSRNAEVTTKPKTSIFFFSLIAIDLSNPKSSLLTRFLIHFYLKISICIVFRKNSRTGKLNKRKASHIRP